MSTPNPRPHRKRLLLLPAALLALALVLWLLWGNTALMVSEYTVTSARLPDGFDGCRIAQVSDLHNASFGEDNADLLTLLREEEPEYIFLTGDLIDSRHTEVDIALDFAEEAAKLAPTYFVTGNHEARLVRSGEYETLRAGLEAAGVTVLENAAVTLERGGDELTLIGVHDPAFDESDDEEGALRDWLTTLLDGAEGYTILLSHRPELFGSVYTPLGFNLVFSGHAHGGQIRLPFVGGLVAPNQGLFPKYDAGLYADGDTTMVVSRGLGNSILPLRINNRPEVVLVTLRAGEGTGGESTVQKAS